MKPVAVLLGLTILAACGDVGVVAPDARAGIVLVDPGFDSGSSLRGWATITDSFSYVVDTKVKRSGRGSLRMSAHGRTPLYGAVNQWVETERYAGKTVELSAFVKTKRIRARSRSVAADPPDGAVLWLSVVGGDGLVAGPSYSSSVAGTSDWSRLSVRLAIPRQGALRMDPALMLYGTNGTAWFDDVTLRTL